MVITTINPGYGFVRTQKIEVPLENDRPLFDAARVARVEEAARVATEASIRTKREAKERSAKKRQEVKQMPLRQLPQCEALDNQQGLNQLLSDAAYQNKHNKRNEAQKRKAANQTISVSDEDNAR
jgi:hypothetical protein